MKYSVNFKNLRVRFFRFGVVAGVALCSMLPFAHAAMLKNFGTSAPSKNAGRSPFAAQSIAVCCADKLHPSVLPMNRQLASLEEVIGNDQIAGISRKPTLERQIDNQPLQSLRSGQISAGATRSIRIMGILKDPKNPGIFYTLELVPGTWNPYQPDRIEFKKYSANPDANGLLPSQTLQSWTAKEAMEALGIDAEDAVKSGLWETMDGRQRENSIFPFNRMDSALFFAEKGKIGIAFSRGVLVSSDGGKSFKPIKSLNRFNVISYRIEGSKKILLTSHREQNGTTSFSILHKEKGKNAISMKLPRFYSTIDQTYPEPTLIRMNSQNSKTVYVGTGKRVFECNTYPNCNPSSWKEIGFDRVGGGMHWDSTVYDLQFDEKYMYAATCNGLYRRSLNGGGWGKISSPVFNSGITTSALDYRERNGINTNRYLRAETSTVNPYNPSQLAVASQGRVFYSADSGNSWRRLSIPDGSNGGGPNSHLYSLTEFLPDGSILIGGSGGSGSAQVSRDSLLYRVKP